VTAKMSYVDNPTDVGQIVQQALTPADLTLSATDERRMIESVRQLHDRLADGGDVYGVTRGFGPLVDYPAGTDDEGHGLGLIHHLCVGQGEPLSPTASALSVWLRLASMRRGHSAVPPDLWRQLADLHRRGFVPVLPSEGSVSASGDLIPLAHAALSLAGQGQAWYDGRAVSAAERIRALSGRPARWRARTALAFVNGSSVSLAVAMLNHLEIAAQARAVAALTGRVVAVLGCNPEAYADPLQRVRGHAGAREAAEWIRAELGDAPIAAADRPLQEPYSLRCVPQVVGAVLDQLRLQEGILLVESTGCTDNPVVIDSAVWHGGNFHAAPIALAVDQQAACAHQLAYLVERQLALVVDPAHNGGRPPLLSARPGASSGLAGVQIAASAFLAKCRQLGYPATLTAMPTNLGNQDHVPMALNGAVIVADIVRLGWLIIGSLAVAVSQLDLLAMSAPVAGVWRELRSVSPPLRHDRPLADEVRAAADLIRRTWGTGLPSVTA